MDIITCCNISKYLCINRKEAYQEDLSDEFESEGF